MLYLGPFWQEINAISVKCYKLYDIDWRRLWEQPYCTQREFHVYKHFQNLMLRCFICFVFIIQLTFR